MSPTAVIVVLIIIIAAVLVIKNMNKKKQSPSADSGSTPAAASKPAESAPETQLQEILDTLVKLNLIIRKDADLSEEITKEIESIIDDLAAVTPAMMERYPSETLTYEMKKIGKEHLLKTVKEYLDLSLESRENQKMIFQKTIASLHDVSKRSRDIVEKNETAEFKTMANFLAGKF